MHFRWRDLPTTTLANFGVSALARRMTRTESNPRIRTGGDPKRTNQTVTTATRKRNPVQNVLLFREGGRRRAAAENQRQSSRSRGLNTTRTVVINTLDARWDEVRARSLSLFMRWWDISHPIWDGSWIGFGWDGWMDRVYWFLWVEREPKERVLDYDTECRAND